MSKRKTRQHHRQQQHIDSFFCALFYVSLSFSCSLIFSVTYGFFSSVLFHWSRSSLTLIFVEKHTQSLDQNIHRKKHLQCIGSQLLHNATSIERFFFFLSLCTVFIFFFWTHSWFNISIFQYFICFTQITVFFISYECIAFKSLHFSLISIFSVLYMAFIIFRTLFVCGNVEQ